MKTTHVKPCNEQNPALQIYKALKRMKAVVAVALTALLISITGANGQTIGISGLAGAEHWVWFEGENFTTGSGAAVFRDNPGVSGWMEGAPGPANAYVRSTGSSNVGNVTFNIYAPAAMSAQTEIYTRARTNITGTMSITVDNTLVVTPANTQIVGPGPANPTQFAEWQIGGAEPTSLGTGIATGPLTAGQHTFLYSAGTYASTGMNSFMVDGLLIYDGNPVLPSVAGTSRSWLLNPGSWIQEVSATR